MTFKYQPPEGPLDVLFWDANLIVLNKPSGLLSVPGRAVDHKDCLQSRVEAEFGTALVVHRLDMDTSGVIVMAFDKDTLRDLSKQFENKTTAKTYVCLVAGIVAEDSGIVDLPLRCDWPNRPLQMVDHKQGKKAETHWRVLERHKDQTRLELTPITGRSHQLRVHCLSMGHPIIGDRFYAPADIVSQSERLCLHAQSLSFTHSVSGERMTITADCNF
ncbi:pseudouridine synthase [Terasakiella sp. A23]|uniref:pseudouridine synthase n=1 Tax=Terasakiella sp. FCG-A23 TaxID=3080561 RepID=UPI00295589A5|nr:pseudouridine synthase [Terasakiella sp. A23]MDV7338928.1 pseudouridine synthase [Terasakiella sp. A23]